MFQSPIAMILKLNNMFGFCITFVAYAERKEKAACISSQHFV